MNLSRSKISIQIVTWNSFKFLPDCLESISQQTFKDFSVLVIDNASNDGTQEYIEGLIQQSNQPSSDVHRTSADARFCSFTQSLRSLRFIQNRRNLGFAQAHNQGIVMTDSEYVLVMNPDVILEPDFLERIVNVAEKNKKAGSFGGKLLKAKITNIESNKEMALNPLKFGALMHPNWCIVKTDIIDSTGLKIFKSRRVIDRGEEEKDTGQYDRQEEVFGISGACVLYRREALEDIKIPKCDPKTRIHSNDSNINSHGRVRSALFAGEYFDQDFFCYKEDIDLAWRLQLRGWKAIYVPEAKAYHLRTVSIANRFSKSVWVNFLSYRNHLWMLLKNDYFRNFLLHLWHIFWYQLAKEIYLLFTQPLVLWKGSFAFWQGFFKMYKKRWYIMKNAKIAAGEIRQWFN